MCEEEDLRVGKNVFYLDEVSAQQAFFKISSNNRTQALVYVGHT